MEATPPQPTIRSLLFIFVMINRSRRLSLSNQDVSYTIEPNCCLTYFSLGYFWEEKETKEETSSKTESDSEWEGKFGQSFDEYCPRELF